MKDLIKQESSEKAALLCSHLLAGKTPSSVEQAQQLLKELFECTTCLFCPRGRPIFSFLTIDELQKRFR